MSTKEQKLFVSLLDNITDWVRNDVLTNRGTDWHGRPGNPEDCQVLSLHKRYTDSMFVEWASNGCKNATIGCLECKQPVIDSLHRRVS